MKAILTLGILVISFVAGAPLEAQNAPDAMPRSQTNTLSNQSDHAKMPMGDHEPEMETMARSLTSMAEICRTMMEKEMKGRPLKIAAAAVLGTLLTVVLVLFIVLEIQWIRFWNLRIKSERAALLKRSG